MHEGRQLQFTIWRQRLVVRWQGWEDRPVIIPLSLLSPSRHPTRIFLTPSLLSVICLAGRQWPSWHASFTHMASCFCRYHHHTSFTKTLLLFPPNYASAIPRGWRRSTSIGGIHGILILWRMHYVLVYFIYLVLLLCIGFNTICSILYFINEWM